MKNYLAHLIAPKFIDKKSLALTISPLLLLPLSSVAQVYWGQTSYSADPIYDGTISTVTNWYTDAAGTTVAGAAPSGDDVVFNTTPANTVGGTVIVDTEFSASSITFNTSELTTFTHDASNNRSITLGSGGITLGASSGKVNIGVSSSAQLSLNITDSQTWTNNSNSDLTVRYIGSQAGSGAKVMTMSLNGDGDIITPFKITDSDSDPITLVVNSSGNGLVKLSSATGASAYRGGTFILQGGLSATSSLGNGDVTLGDTTGSNSAQLIIKTNSFTNDLIVRSGSTGTKALTNTYTAGVLNFSGNIILNDDLALASSASMLVSGDISGAAGITKTGNNTLTFSGNNTFTGDLKIEQGTFTLDQLGTLTFAIGANGANNQLDGLLADDILLDGTFYFDLSGAALDEGNSWSIVLASSATYGATFAITGFTEDSGTWSNGSGLIFSESTGELTYAIPEPGTYALLLGAGTFLILFRKRAR